MLKEAICISVAAFTVAAASAEMFPFVISHGALGGAVDMSGLLEAPAGRHGRVFVKDGHFATAKGPIRFNATNLTGPANIPSKGFADRLAARIARFGFNCVRLHFLDTKGYGSFKQPFQPCLLVDTGDPFDIVFDRERLDRLDYLVHCFKKRGIYVNLNMHVARFMGYLDKMRSSEKGYTWLDPAIIESEKKFVRMILSHRNPYTGMTWAEDPVVAMIELNNEDAAFDACYKAVCAGGSRFARLIADLEKKYLHEMKGVIRGELKCDAPLCGTQVTYTSCHVNGVLDYFDAHEYWCHPSPVTKEWMIWDKAQVNHPADNCISWLASRRARGYPYTVSEYNNPYPNRTGAEGQILLHAYAAYQNWDGVFQYTYDNREDNEPDHVEYFFSLAGRSDVLAHMGACAAMYLKGGVRKAGRVLSVPCRSEDYFRRFDGKKIIFDDATQTTGGKIPYGAGLVTGLEIVLEGKDASLPVITNGTVFVSDTRELEWNADVPGAGFFVLRAPDVKAFTGFVRSRVFDLGDGVSLKVGKTLRDWATFSVFAKEGCGMGDKGPVRLLLALTGQAHNTGAKFTEHARGKAGEPRISTRGDDWGRGPFLVEGVNAVVDIPADAAKTSCWALDGSGNRRAAVPVSSVEGKSRIAIGPKWRTVWYEIAVTR